ncbi:MAG: protein kinase [Pseudomonadales bacterium]
MTPEQWRRLEAAFHDLAGAPENSRTAFIREFSAQDPELGSRLADLLAAHRDAGGFLVQPALDLSLALASTDEDPPELAGQVFGAYRVVRELGRGGMGAVYLAERADREFSKFVALKLIKRGMDSDALIERFRAERQILANLDHPNIARLLDGGTAPDGRPYLVMEYVEGSPIDEYCAQHALDLEARLALFRRVCAAVVHAHQHLVVHRDLKPSNILVTREGAPKLLDFGLARVLSTDDARTSAVTAAAGRFFTPGYASPEHVRGLPATTLSDVYSLGAVLYRLLCGCTPHEQRFGNEPGTAEEATRVLPARPSVCIDPERVRATLDGDSDAWRAAWSKRLTGDLDNIALRALHPDPARRYASVGQLDEDLARYVAGMPVTAAPDSLTYRAGKFVSRHAAAVVVAVSLTVALMGAVVVSTWQSYRAAQSERLATQQRARAEQRFADVRRLAHTLIFDYHDAIADLPGSTAVRMRLVSDALAYLDGLAAEAAGEPELQRELAAAYERVGDVQGGALFANLGDTASAIASQRKALAIRQALTQADPEDQDAQREFALSRRKVGLLLWETGALGDAVAELRGSQATFEGIAARRPEDPAILFELATTFDYIGMLQQELGELEAALVTLGRARETFVQAQQQDPDNAIYRRGLSTVDEHFAAALLLLGRYPEALAYNQIALDLRTALSAETPLSMDLKRILAVSHYNQGEILARMGRYAEALQHYQADLAIAEALQDADPANDQYRSDVTFGRVRLGDMSLALGSPEEALEWYQDAARRRSEDVDSDPLQLWKRASLIEARSKVADALSRLGKDAAAIRQARETAALLDATQVEPGNAYVLTALAEARFVLAEAYERLAAGAKPGQGPELNARAATLYAGAHGVWQTLAAQGRVAPPDRQRMIDAGARAERLQMLAGTGGQ